MTFSGGKLREVKQMRAQARERRKIITFIGISAIALSLLVVLWYSNAEASKPANHYVAYDPDLVVYDQPMQAVHQMDAPLSSSSSVSESGPQPKVVLGSDFFDFKQVGATEVVQHDFILANEGEAPLTISSAFTTCACTTADFSGTVIPPGKIAIITLTFDAGYHDARGQTVRRGVIIQTNDPSNPQVEIWTQASVQMTP